MTETRINEPRWPILDPPTRRSEVAAYFAAKASTYDDTDVQTYWQFSDDLLWSLFQDLVLNGCPSGSFSVLDAGAGTGRWSLRVLEHLPNATGVLIDASPEMLEQARAKLTPTLNLRTRLAVGDLDTDEDLGQHELVLCFHNVLSFVVDPTAVIQRLLSATRPGGRLVLVVPNYYHALYFAMSTGQWDQLASVRDRHTISFHPGCPEMFLFTPELLSLMLRSFGASSVTSLGFPVSLYPGMAETTQNQTSGSVAAVLSDASRRAELLSLERAVCANSEAAARGNNLLVVATKGEG